jgi:HEAT repeat protein
MDFIEKSRTDRSYLFTRGVAIESLVEFGAQAKPAVPTLIGLLTDSEAYIRHDASNALKEIDPDAAAKAGVKLK